MAIVEIKLDTKRIHPKTNRALEALLRVVGLKKFEKGSRVKLSKRGIDQGFSHGPGRNEGTVVSSGVKPGRVAVLRDDNKTAVYWDEEFWTPIPIRRRRR